MVKLASLNIACDDEKFNPLWKRLPSICNFLTSSRQEHNFDIVCVQDIKSTGMNCEQQQGHTPLFWGPYDVAYKLCQALSCDNNKWEFIMYKTSASRDSCYVATFWNPDKYVCTQTVNFRPKITTHCQPCYLLMKHHFTMVDSPDGKTAFQVFNCQASQLDLNSKLEYWKLVKHDLCMSYNGVALGVMNKTHDSVDDYNTMFSCDDDSDEDDRTERQVSDRIRGETTFVPFDYNDKISDSSSQQASLDCIITAKQHIVTTTIIPTMVTNYDDIRPTNHFLVIADVKFN